MQNQFPNLLSPLRFETQRHALIRYGGGIVQMSGSIAGNTHARNRFGNYMRARTKPVNPRSARQSAARIAIMMLAEQWRDSPMTDAKRIAWQTYANSVNWLNKLGETVTLTGFNMFIRGNAVKIAAGLAIVTDGPTDLGLPAGDPLFAISNASAAGQNFDITFDDNFDWVTEDGAALLIDFGEPQNPTRNFFNSPWRYNGRLLGSVGDPWASPMVGAAVNAWTLVEGQKLWVRASILRADGRVSTKFQADPFIVGA